MTSKRSSARVLVALLAVTGSLALGVAGAGADAADPVLTATTGTVVKNADGSRTVTVHGAWQWPTHKSDCTQDKRAVGFAVDWADPNQPGNVVTTLNGRTIAVGDSADNLVHHTGAGADSADPNVWRGTCGTFQASLGYNTGTWGPIAHTYAASYQGPITVCALMYDVHLKANGGAPHNVKEITAGGKTHNGDNSAESNKNTPLGNGCFQATLSPGATPTPGLTLVKTERIAGTGTFVTGPVTAAVGQTIEYQMVVTNTGQLSESVTLTDSRCDAGTINPTGAHTLAPGASMAFTCTHKLVAGDSTTFTNVAIATATASNGATIGPVSSQVVAKVPNATGVLGAKKVKKVTRKAKPAHARVRAARFTG